MPRAASGVCGRGAFGVFHGWEAPLEHCKNCGGWPPCMPSISPMTICPSALEEKCVPGVRVAVPFGKGKRRSEGIVLEVISLELPPAYSLKPVESVLDDAPVLDDTMLHLAAFLRSGISVLSSTRCAPCFRRDCGSWPRIRSF